MWDRPRQVGQTAGHRMSDPDDSMTSQCESERALGHPQQQLETMAGKMQEMMTRNAAMREEYEAKLREER